LLHYINNNNIKYIAINGNFGKEFVAENCTGSEYIVRELSYAEQEELEKRYLGGEKMSQIIGSK